MQPFVVQPQLNRRHPLHWWYWLSCAALEEPTSSTPLVQREQFRRTRMASNILLFVIVLTCCAFPAAFFGTNPILLSILLVSLLIEAVALLCNRLGNPLLAGSIIVLLFEVDIATNLITTPGGLNALAVPIFDLLVLPILFAVFILPVWAIVSATISNIVFTLIGLRLLPTADLSRQLMRTYPGVVSVPCFLFVLVCFVGVLWIRSVERAIARADQADERSRLERDLAAQRRAAQQKKEQLEQGMQQIAQALAQAANGNYSVRVPELDTLFWPIRGPLNTLLARLNHLRQLEQEQQHLQQSILSFVHVIKTARQHPDVLHTLRTRTPLDELLVEIAQHNDHLLLGGMDTRRLP